MKPSAGKPASTAGSSPEVRDDIQDLAFQRHHKVSMMFFPKAWASAPDIKRKWERNEFPPIPRSAIPSSPGVYAFVVMTELFDFPHANGLFYIGKAKNLYSRIGEYTGNTNIGLMRTRRPLVWNMLNTWSGHLKYFYTTTVSVAEAEALEMQMLSAFRPPFNRQFEATLSKSMRAFT